MNSQTSRFQVRDRKVSCKGCEESHISFSDWQVVLVGVSLFEGYKRLSWGRVYGGLGTPESHLPEHL